MTSKPHKSQHKYLVCSIQHKAKKQAVVLWCNVRHERGAAAEPSCFLQYIQDGICGKPMCRNQIPATGKFGAQPPVIGAVVVPWFGSWSVPDREVLTVSTCFLSGRSHVELLLLQSQPSKASAVWPLTENQRVYITAALQGLIFCYSFYVCKCFRSGN